MATSAQLNFNANMRQLLTPCNDIRDIFDWMKRTSLYSRPYQLSHLSFAFIVLFQTMKSWWNWFVVEVWKKAPQLLNNTEISSRDHLCATVFWGWTSCFGLESADATQLPLKWNANSRYLSLNLLLCHLMRDSQLCAFWKIQQQDTQSKTIHKTTLKAVLKVKVFSCILSFPVVF